MNDGKVRWAVVGAGDIVRKRAGAAILEQPDSVLHACVEVDPESKRETIDFLGPKHVYTEVDQMATDDAIDAVYVATPVHLHAEHAIAAMEAGKDVLVEKPMALDPREADRMCRTAERTGRRLAVAYFRRFSPRFELAKQMLDDGTFGRVVLVRIAVHSWYGGRDDGWRERPEFSGGGVLSDVGVHKFDLLAWWFGLPRRVVADVGTLVHDYPVEDSSTILMAYENGMQVNASFHWNSKTWTDEIHIVGTEAKLTLHPADGTEAVITVGRDTETRDVPNPANVHAPLIDDFARSIIEDRPPRFDGRDGSAAGRDHGCGLSVVEDRGMGGIGVVGGRQWLPMFAPGRNAVVIFAPKPENDFAFFIRTYYEACRRRCNKIEAIAGKWMFRDLLPGMSDFDARFIVSDDMTCDDWCRMSSAVGETHQELCEKYPVWARILEHLPGVNVTWHELTSEESYYPEYQQWTFYHTSVPERLDAAERTLFKRGLDAKDEYFHLGRFCTYFGRYNRSIDRPINMGIHENKYPLHSRLMHYFAPPVHSAMFILDGRAYVGKFDALEAAAKAFPSLRCWDYLWEILGKSYASSRWYDEDALVELEDALEEGLIAIAGAIREKITLIPPDAGVDVTAWRQVLANIRIDPAMEFFHQVKFSRLMKGRLRFYANAPRHFETDWLIRNELGRIGDELLHHPLSYCLADRGREGGRVTDRGDRRIARRLAGERRDCSREDVRASYGGDARARQGE